MKKVMLLLVVVSWVQLGNCSEESEQESSYEQQKQLSEEKGRRAVDRLDDAVDRIKEYKLEVSEIRKPLEALSKSVAAYESRSQTADKGLDSRELLQMLRDYERVVAKYYKFGERIIQRDSSIRSRYADLDSAFGDSLDGLKDIEKSYDLEMAEISSDDIMTEHDKEIVYGHAKLGKELLDTLVQKLVAVRKEIRKSSNGVNSKVRYVERELKVLNINWEVLRISGNPLFIANHATVTKQSILSFQKDLNALNEQLDRMVDIIRESSVFVSST